MFHEMSNWSMMKDYSGAECFSDGSRPLIAETAFADITISGVPGKAAVSIGVYPYGEICDYYYEGEAAAKELAVKTGTDIAGYISARDDGPFMFINGGFGEFFRNLPVSNIRTHTAEAENTPHDSFEQSRETEQGAEI